MDQPQPPQGLQILVSDLNVPVNESIVEARPVASAMDILMNTFQMFEILQPLNGIPLDIPQQCKTLNPEHPPAIHQQNLERGPISKPIDIPGRRSMDHDDGFKVGSPPKRSHLSERSDSDTEDTLQDEANDGATNSE